MNATERAVTLKLPNHGIEVVIRGDDDAVKSTLDDLAHGGNLFREDLASEAVEALEFVDSPFTFTIAGNGDYDVHYNGDFVAQATFNNQSEFELHFNRVDIDNLAVTDLPWDMLVRALHTKWERINKRS